MLRNIDVTNARPTAHVQKIADAGGLFLEVRPTGAKYWRYRYRIAGKPQTFTIGPCGDKPHEFTIAAARLARSAAEALVRQGIHPRTQRKDEIAARIEARKETFAVTAAAWLTTKKHVSAHYFNQLEAAVQRDINPVIGDTMLREVKTRTVWEGVIEPRGHTPAWAKLLQRVVSEIYCYAITLGAAEFDPAYPLRGAIGEKGSLLKTEPKQHNPWLELREVPEFLTAVDAAPADEHITKLGIRILMLTLVRPGELAGAPWSEFNLDGALWDIPAERMKMGRRHLVPLSTQAVALLRELHALTGDTPYLFPERAARKRAGVVPKLANVFARFIRLRTGFAGRLTAHGLRGTASTALNDDGRFNFQWVEAQLSHAKVGVAGHYNHAGYMQHRAPMMQAWADMVMPANVGTNVVEFRRAA